MRIPPHLPRVVCWMTVWATTCAAVIAQSDRPPGQPALKTLVRDAFMKVHEGWSSDEVLLQDELNRRFIAECRAADGALTEFQCNWALLTLRKSGGLAAKVTRRCHDAHDAYRHAAEIAARWVEDKQGVNTDRALCDPATRAEFDRIARSAAPEIEPYLLRKAAFGLRKARRLRPEYVVRVADWGREVNAWSLQQLRQELDQLPEGPGVYLFRDQTGYLYIGEASNLADRVRAHLTISDRASLAHYFEQVGLDSADITLEIHAFDPDSNARLVAHRRAYESELIESRKPRFNVRP